MRLNRYLARAGVCSRRKADNLITAGLISVNEKVVTDLGVIVNDDDDIKVNDKVITLPKFVYYALNKPKGYVTTRADKYARKTVYDLLPKDNSLFSVGRLDKDTKGPYLNY
jgi:23S rRNA pseudouridine2605 synthase